MKSLSEIAEQVYRTARDESPDPFHIQKAVVFTFTEEGLSRELSKDLDIYLALANIGYDNTIAEGELGIGIITTGWAAPINSDGDVDCPPSQHKERRRVRLVSVVTTDGKMGSVMGFSDDDENPIRDEGEATGNLAMAMLESVLRISVKSN